MADQAKSDSPNNTAARGRYRGRGRGRGGAASTAAPAAAAESTTTTAAAPFERRLTKPNPYALFVAGFGEGTTAQDVGPTFEKYGPVRLVRLNARGVGRVDYETTEGAANAVAQLHGTDFKNGKLRIEPLKGTFRRRFIRQPRAEGDAPRAPRAPRAEGEAPRAPRAPRAEGEAPRAPRPARAPRAAPAAAANAATSADAAPAKARPARAPRAPRAAYNAAPAAPAEVKPKDPSRVFVGRLVPENNDDEIKAIFSKFGEIANYDRSRNGRFAVIQYSSVANATKAVEAAKPTLGEKELRVEHEDPNFGANKAANRRPRAPRAPRAEQAPVDPATLDKKHLYFGYLPEQTYPDNVTKAFAGVVNVSLRGKYGFVTFDTEANAQNAIANPKNLGPEVRIEVANRGPRPRRGPKTPKSESTA